MNRFRDTEGTHEAQSLLDAYEDAIKGKTNQSEPNKPRRGFRGGAEGGEGSDFGCILEFPVLFRAFEHTSG